MKSDVTLAELSEAGDKYIKDRSVGQINDGEILRSKGDYESGRYTGSLSAQTLGICHPTTAQLDYIICNNALKTGNPLKAEGSQLLKLQVGAHIDGYGAVVGGNFLLGESLAAKKLAKAATEVAKLVLDTIKVSIITSKRVVALIDNLFPLLLAWRASWHQHTQYDIQGPKEIDLFPSDDKPYQEGIFFETGEVYTVEVWITDAEDPAPQPAVELDKTLHQIPPSKDISGLSAELKEAYKCITDKVRLHQI
ncbi:hypothetical protein I309_04315 [Cryptococcus deuterogattii LA55]|nr:hypothetical protein I309_04315 [Cryptococcus deuterogattii LA55]KIR95989.1 hypothetical protein I304_00754 [Cryptococcus deuterogattii CBS 10090]